MDASEILRQSRRRSRLTQRELHNLTGVAQPTIARIESGTTVPRVDTLNRLLEACGETLIPAPATPDAAERALTRYLLRNSSDAHLSMLMNEWWLPEREKKRMHARLEATATPGT
jgi:predicted transcriptional regulator